MTYGPFFAKINGLEPIIKLKIYSPFQVFLKGML